MPKKTAEIDTRNQAELVSAFQQSDFIVTKQYLSFLEELPVKELKDDKYVVTKHSQFFKLGKMVYDKDENNIQKLTNVYAAMAALDANIALIIQSDGSNVDFYVGVCDEADSASCNSKTEAFYNNIVGNFPGSVGLPFDVKTKKEKRALLFNDDLTGVINNCFKMTNTSISAVSGVASIRQQDIEDNSEFTQGIEKMLEAMKGNEFSAIFIAKALSKAELVELKAEYELLYTNLVPYSKSVLTMSENEAEGVSKTISNALSDSVGTTKSTALSIGESKSTAHTEGTSVGHTDTVGAYAGGGGKVFHAGANYSHSFSRTKSFSDTTTFGTSETNTKSFAENKNHTVTVTNADGTQTTYSLGKSLQLNYENKSVTSLLENIDEQLKRIKSTESFGVFAAAAYFIAPDKVLSTMAASAYKSIISGTNTCVENATINTWNTDNNYDEVRKYLSRLQHPVFVLNESNTVTPASVVSGQELAVQFSLPKKSVSGLPVVECAEFGRNVMSVDDKYRADLEIGHIYHMNNDEDTDVCISSKDLTAHTFITGSTGAGKSNAIYQLLAKTAHEKKAKFMVIEPAKGEYKDVFGLDEKLNVSVYGTNPKVAPLLRINPFKFPDSTHIYEHMDKLVEIFNVCWPMYAAMPAVLKAALEKAYISAGWDLMSSQNKTGVNIYPTFASVAREVKKYIDKSEYSEENKGNYKGSLLTRLESLTNGINGMIFTADDLKDEELFDENVIVDLSRVGSTETKALIMGILVMKLQEYRSAGKKKNSDLKHITVLEEAHNLLKRTSTEQSMEGSNLIGKSVEMLANSIAEMRTYGEGFIIADQAPGLLDMSVIRNTNTKIILRLPDYSDRELVGKSANLNDSQIDELAKLKTGVAAVYQNGWVAPVLCQFDRYEVLDENANFEKADTRNFEDEAVEDILNLIMKSDIRNTFDDADADELKAHIIISNLPDWLKVDILECFVAKNDVDRGKKIARIAYEFFKAEQTLEQVSNANDIIEWQNRLKDTLMPSVKEFAEYEIEHLLALLVHEHYLTHNAYEPIYLSYMEYLGKKYNY